MPSDEASRSGSDQSKKSTASSTGLPWSHQEIAREAAASFSFPKAKTSTLFSSTKPPAPLETGASSLFQNKPSASSTTTNGTKSSSSSSSQHASSSRNRPQQQHSPSPSGSSASTTPRLPPSPVSSAPSSKQTPSSTESIASSTWVSQPSQLLKPAPPSKRLGTGQPAVAAGGARDQQQKSSGSSSRPSRESSTPEDEKAGENGGGGSSSSLSKTKERTSTTRASGPGSGGGFADFASSTNNNNAVAKSKGLDWLASSTGDGFSDGRGERNSGSPFEGGSGSAAEGVAKSSSPARTPEIFGRPAASTTSNTPSQHHSHTSFSQKSSKSSQQQHKPSNSKSKSNSNPTYLDLLTRPSHSSSSSSSSAPKRTSSSSLTIPPFANKSASVPPPSSNSNASKGSGAAKSSRGGSSASSSKGDGGSGKLSSIQENDSGVSSSGGGSSGRKRPRTEHNNDDGHNSARRERVSVLQSIEETYRDVEEKERTIDRLRSEIASQEKRHKELDGQLSDARKLAQSSRNKFNAVGDTVTSLITAKQAIDDQRRKLELEVQGLRSLLEEVQDLDQQHNSWIKSSTSFIEKQRRTLDEVIYPLRTERDEAILKAERSEQTLEVLREELEGKKREVEERRERVRILEGDVDRKVETIRGLASDLKNGSGEEQRLQIDQRKNELTTATERADAAEQSIEDERKDRDSRISRLERQVTDLEKDLREKEGDLDRLRKDLEKERESMKRSKSLITKLESELSTTKEDLESSRDDVKRERGLLEASTASLEEVKKGHSETKEELGETRQKLTDLGETLKETEERAAVVVKAKKNLEKSHADLETTIQNLKSDQASNSDQVTKANSKTQEAELEIQTLKRDLRAANQAKDDSAADLKLANSQVSDLEKRVSSTSSTISTTRTEKTSLEEKIAVLEAERTSLQGDKRQMQRDLDDAREQADERDQLAQSIKDAEAKKATILDRYLSGEAEPDEITMVEAISKAVEESHETEHNDAIKKLENKVKEVEKERRELAVKLAKSNAGKSRNITSSSPVVPLSDTREATSPPSPCPAHSDAGSEELAALKLADNKALRHPPQPTQQQYRSKSEPEPEDEIDQLANDDGASGSDDDVKILSEPTIRRAPTLSDPASSTSNKDAPIEITSSSPVAASVPRASPAQDDEEEHDELVEGETESAAMEGVKELFSKPEAAEVEAGGGSRIGEAVGEGSTSSSKGTGGGVGTGAGWSSRKRAIEDAIPESSPPPPVVPSPKRLRNGRIAAAAPASVTRNNSNGRRRAK